MNPDQRRGSLCARLHAMLCATRAENTAIPIAVPQKSAQSEPRKKLPVLKYLLFENYFNFVCWGALGYFVGGYSKCTENNTCGYKFGTKKLLTKGRSPLSLVPC